MELSTVFSDFLDGAKIFLRSDALFLDMFLVFFDSKNQEISLLAKIVEFFLESIPRESSCGVPFPGLPGVNAVHWRRNRGSNRLPCAAAHMPPRPARGQASR